MSKRVIDLTSTEVLDVEYWPDENDLRINGATGAIDINNGAVIQDAMASYHVKSNLSALMMYKAALAETLDEIDYVDKKWDMVTCWVSIGLSNPQELDTLKERMNALNTKYWEIKQDIEWLELAKDLSVAKVLL